MQTETPDRTGGAVRHIGLETAGSTNAEALARARAGERGPLWITAKTQTAGRGRGGRTWVSPPGNLYATLLLTEPCEIGHAPQLAFVAGVAAHDAVAQCAPGLAHKLALKWPNDLLLGGSKLAGILIESEGAPALTLAIGIGMNCAAHPDDTAYPATNLAAAGVHIAPSTLFAALTDAMQRRLAQWSRGEGFGDIRRDWLARAAGLGQQISVRLAERAFTGRFEGLDETGRLLLMHADGVSAITAGDVFGLGGA
jgi:BirA family biotin operon repressor/biotin-[acetyl-CoA-carboxylase] ligase